ncbi:hypothetical protein MKW92_026195 [Papaver armeniacum]|nr:hypothetical protein MKW92_026195 [Papaver armeniacum]
MEVLPYNNLFLYLPLILVPLYFLITFIKRNNGDEKKPNFPPGPPKLPIIGNLHQLSKPPHLVLSKLSKTYGPVMLLQVGSVPTIVISSAEAAELVMKTQDLEYCNRIQFAGRKRVTYNFIDLTFTPHGEYWRETRKICIHELLSTKRVQSLAVVRAEEVGVLIDSISSSSNGTPVHIFENTITFTLKTICRAAFGSTAGQRIFDKGGLTKILYEVGTLNGYLASDFFPKVGWIIDWITGIHAKTEKCFHELDNFFQQIIDEHESPERQTQEQEDVIDVLVKLKKDQTTSIRFTDDHIKAFILNVFLGGVDSPAVIVTWTMAELAKNPKEMKKVQEEIRNYVGTKGKVEESDLDNFPYLKMAVKETLRLHPTAPLLTRVSMKHNKINGYDIYPGTKVLINAWAVKRSKVLGKSRRFLAREV